MSNTLRQGLEALKVVASEAQLERLMAYAALIQKWNTVYNLTAIRKPEEIITHHVLDAASILPALDSVASNKPVVRLLDVGAGAGLPGIVLGILRPDWRVWLVDAVQKKAAFMQQAIANLGLDNAQALHARIENFKAEPFDIVCSRAFSSLARFVQSSEHVLAPQGCFAAMKGRLTVDGDVPAGWQLQALVPIEVPFLLEERHLFLMKRPH